jgi:hypothetical protein
VVESPRAVLSKPLIRARFPSFHPRSILVKVQSSTVVSGVTDSVDQSHFNAGAFAGFARVRQVPGWSLPGLNPPSGFNFRLDQLRFDAIIPPLTLIDAVKMNPELSAAVTVYSWRIVFQPRYPPRGPVPSSARRSGRPAPIPKSQTPKVGLGVLVGRGYSQTHTPIRYRSISPASFPCGDPILV